MTTQLYSDAPPVTVRIGLLEGYERTTFRHTGRYRIETRSGQLLREFHDSDLKWRVLREKSTPTKFLYSVLAATFATNAEAMSLAESFEERGVSAAVRQVGGPVEIDGVIVGDNTLYRVQVGNFQSEEDARELLSRLELDYAPRLVREVLVWGSGRLEMFDQSLDQHFESDDGFRLVPENRDCRLTLFGVRMNSGFSYEPTEDRVYSGAIEFYVDHEGFIAALNETPIDRYLRGVVGAEMPPEFPEEALKAQAIASRSLVIAQKTIKHLNDPFDLCAHVHCQIYSGVTHENDRIVDAVTATRGVVLTHNKSIVDAHFSAVCGGHTEDVQATWMTPPMYDGKGVACDCTGTLEVPDLTTETGVRRWIQSRPSSCCNLDGIELPVSRSYGRKHFRWETTLLRSELEEILLVKTGVDIGMLYDIVPIRRGVSGRLMEVEVLGSLANLRIKRELKIRRLLSHSALESTTFLVEVLHDAQGNPMELVLTGAGWGHGVGMCQAGAARMAHDGKSAEEILAHYFPGCVTDKKY
ncbi:MAG: SpoIID/LytB domain-containing protein [Calditrichaeota bacterium]|nr:SpoIID/LytB domain-containing protein [Calditrichota bacterium]MCB9365725.1 SpoIID/LytB domain-containing protein [Calditrichota bacterium]